MLKRLYFSLIFSLSIVFYTQAFAESINSLKIGVIDIKRVINTSKYGQEIMERLQKKYEELQVKLEEKAKEIKALEEEMEKKGALWSQEVRDKKQSEYQRKIREFKAAQEDAQFEMQEYERKLLDPVFKELENVIKEYVEKEKFDLIMEKSQPGIYYASQKIDLSPVIVDLFNKYYEETKAKEIPTKTESSKVKEQPKIQPSPKK